jgi:hypothetical protein
MGRWDSKYACGILKAESGNAKLKVERTTALKVGIRLLAAIPATQHLHGS